MLYEESGFQNWLEAVIKKLGADPLWREDLKQIALIHAWKKETLSPGHKPGWYVRSCLFHLVEHLRRGRSIDSPKHRQARVIVTASADYDAPDSNWAGSRNVDDLFSGVCARDDLRVL